jgi:hypothetical protein
VEGTYSTFGTGTSTGFMIGYGFLLFGNGIVDGMKKTSRKGMFNNY